VFRVLKPVLLGHATLTLIGLATPDVHATPVVKPVLVRTLPHDTQSFTQGLFVQGNDLIESTGRYGSSWLRRIDATNGEIKAEWSLSRDYFGEGIAQVGEELYWLTWREEVAFVFDAKTFAQKSQRKYSGEGWGLCYNGHELWMSDGSSTLSARDPQTFAIVATLDVYDTSGEVAQLNELECVGDKILANIWMSRKIAEINGKTGEVLRYIDGDGLLAPEEEAGVDVLNGIAYSNQTQTLWLTGKFWPHIFEVRVDGLESAIPEDPPEQNHESSTPLDPPPATNREGGCATMRAPAPVSGLILCTVVIWCVGIQRRSRARQTKLANA
jgi:glutaminyl-peptide cyclotransferase